MHPAIALNQVAFGFSGNGPFVFEKLDLTIQQGEFRAILGMNGSGKSTLAKLICGILKPTQGEIRVEGALYDASTDNHLRTRVGLVFQNPDHQWITSSVDEEIAFGLCQMGLASDQIERRVKEAKDFFNINALSQSAPHQLSGGEKRRVALASIWVLNPDIWIFDEPMAYLDEAGRSFMKDWLLTLKSTSKTVIYLGHQFEEANYFDTLSILFESKIVWEGSPKSIRTNDLNQWGIGLPEASHLWMTITKSAPPVPLTTKEELIKALWG